MTPVRLEARLTFVNIPNHRKASVTEEEVANQKSRSPETAFRRRGLARRAHGVRTSKRAKILESASLEHPGTIWSIRGAMVVNSTPRRSQVREKPG